MHEGINLTMGRSDWFTAREPLFFTDKNSDITLDSASLTITSSGATLTKGTLTIGNKVNIVIDPQSLVSPQSALIIGDNTAADDMSIIILPGSIMDIQSGQLIYRNVNLSSLKLLDSFSQLRMEANTILNLDKPIDMGPGGLYLHSSTIYILGPGADIFGSVNFFG